MTFLETFFDHLADHPKQPFLFEVHGDSLVSATGAELTAWIAQARITLRERGVQPGDRVVLLAPNSLRWVAADLAILAEGAVVVPLYVRQAAPELAAMMRDADPRVVLCAEAATVDLIRNAWPEAPLATFTELFTPSTGRPAVVTAPYAFRPADPVTIIYTSGTSGEPKGVVLTAANVDHLLPVTADALARLRVGPSDVDRVFHYLPFCFAGSRMILWTCLLRATPVMMSTDLTNLATELRTAAPHYVLNVPALLERIRSRVEDQLRVKSKVLWNLYRQALVASAQTGPKSLTDRAALLVARRVIFPRIRRQIGPNLVCLICGSAPLAEETQRWFERLGLPVYQVYGLTETTAIVTMDTPGAVTPGRVGRAIAGCTTKCSEEDELLVQGPNVFAGYWRRPEATAEVLHDGWFHTGDRAEVDASGNWKILGRKKDLLVPTSGHNVAPEPIEARIVRHVPGAEQAVVVGHGRPFLTTIITGNVRSPEVQSGLDAVNAALPHYQRIRAFYLSAEPFTPESGLLTANQKLRRRAVEERFQDEIEALYAVTP